MAHYKIISSEEELIPSVSVYNHNYYRNVNTDNVILEILHEDDGFAEYWSY